MALASARILAIHKFARAIAAGHPIELFGDGSSARDYTYITDIVDGIMACLQQNFGYEIFNLGGSNPTKLSRLLESAGGGLGEEGLG